MNLALDTLAKPQSYNLSPFLHVLREASCGETDKESMELVNTIGLRLNNVTN
jgi:hypothetical protein